jgi:hypothetical protein
MIPDRLRQLHAEIGAALALLDRLAPLLGALEPPDRDLVAGPPFPVAGNGSATPGEPPVVAGGPSDPPPAHGVCARCGARVHADPARRPAAAVLRCAVPERGERRAQGGGRAEGLLRQCCDDRLARRRPRRAHAAADAEAAKCAVLAGPKRSAACARPCSF